MDELKVIIAGGGTGGHVYPGLAMLDALRERGGSVNATFVGAHGGAEEGILAAERLVLLPGRGLRGASAAARLSAPLWLARAVWRGIGVARALRPDVVIGTGGYASAAMVIAAMALRIPRVLQEQNSVPGLVNRRLARFADLVLLSFAGSERYLPRGARWQVVGNPLRPMPRPSRAEAARRLGLDPALPTVLVVGGSRGAHALNLAAVDAARRMLAAGDVQFVLLTGRDDRETVGDALRAEAGRVKVIAYLEDMHDAYAAADVAAARSGASSLFELAAFGVPTVFVPYPHAADAHQARNAAALVERGAALVVRDAELTGERLAGEVSALLADAGRREGMRRALAQWAPTDAAQRAAAAVVEVAKKKARGAGVPEPVAA
jgi:UDP-N-acetylglucosamine--N-acetylmuramyl-(pentapeptide) pyrophosphoryl-undecaprenol N-acetylglucosamine transferase